MTCLLDRETFRRWERWFNQHRHMAIPDRYEIRHYVNPYAKEIAAGKQLHPDPPPRPPKPEKSEKRPKPEAPPSLDADEIEELQQAEADLKQVRRRVEENVPFLTREERVERKRASARHRRLQELWNKAEKAADKARGLDRVLGGEEK